MKTAQSSQPANMSVAKNTASSATRPAARVGEKSRRGFAAMDPELQRRIAREGGKASHESGKGHRFTPEEAREAGRKGGQISRRGPSNASRAAA